MPSKKIIDKNALQYLQSEWSKAKADGWTQRKLADKLGIAQATVSQYLGGIIPLNINLLINVAKLLRLNPTELGVKEVANGLGQPRKLMLPVAITTSGIKYKEKLLSVAGTIENKEEAFLVEVDSNNTEFTLGSHLICEKVRVGANQSVCAIKGDSVLAGTLKTDGESWFVITNSNGELRKNAIDKTWDVSKITGVVLPENEPQEWF